MVTTGFSPSSVQLSSLGSSLPIWHHLCMQGCARLFSPCQGHSAPLQFPSLCRRSEERKISQVLPALILSLPFRVMGEEGPFILKASTVAAPQEPFLPLPTKSKNTTVGWLWITPKS